MRPDLPSAAHAADERSEPEAPPPILGTWRRMYELVLLTLLAVIVLLTLLTRIYS